MGQGAPAAGVSGAHPRDIEIAYLLMTAFHFRQSRNPISFIRAIPKDESKRYENELSDLMNL